MERYGNKNMKEVMPITELKKIGETNDTWNKVLL